MTLSKDELKYLSLYKSPVGLKPIVPSGYLKHLISLGLLEQKLGGMVITNKGVDALSSCRLL